MTGAQIRAARALLDWSADQLARVTKIGIATIRRAESDSGAVRMTPANEKAVREALEAEGIVFIPANGGGEGVRLKERRA